MTRVAFIQSGQSGIGNFMWTGTDDFNVYGAIGGSDGHGPAVLGVYVSSSEPNGVWQPLKVRGQGFVVIVKNILQNIPGPRFQVNGIPDEIWSKPFVLPDWVRPFMRT